MHLSTAHLLRLTLIFSLFASWYPVSGKDFIPSVEKCQYTDGSFSLTESTSLVFDESLRDIARYMLDYIPFRSFSAKGDESKLRLCVDESLQREAYTIDVSDNSVTISGGGYGGVFNGVMTLFQLLPPQVYSREMTLPVSIPCCRISDHPYFKYRWMCLDVARTWISADAVKRYLDLLAYHKINTLHFHLADDEGWRVELKSHPEFATVGGFRGGDSPVHPRYDKFDEKWGGYYTQEELRSIVQYAKQRNIEVIPEIDMPGHSKALGYVCEDIKCSYTPDMTRTNGIDIRNVWCVSKESNYRIIDDIVREMSGIFPSEYFHIGGDEVVSSVWDSCPSCSRLKAEKGYTETRQLQDYFMSRVVGILSEYGKKPVVWSDGIHGSGLPSSTIVCAWKSKACRATVDMGFPTIVLPGEYFYMDMKQSKNEFGHNWSGIVDARKTYSYSFKDYTPKQLANVAGVGATFFSEIYVEHNPESSDYLDYMLFPRICSVSDVAWRNPSSVTRTWDEFYASLTASHYERMSEMNIAFRLFPPVVAYKDGKLSASVDDGSTLYYSDGGDWIRYRSELNTRNPERYVFQSRKGSGHSFEVRPQQYYTEQKPVTHVTSSMEFASDKALSKIERYEGGIVRTRRAAHEGDWIQYSFDECVRSREIIVQTGHVHLRRCLFLTGHVEVSYDSVNFTTIGNLHNGGLAFVPEQDVRAVRVVCDSRSDAEDNVVVSSITIR